jgi:hypothetical protein
MDIPNGANVAFEGDVDPSFVGRIALVHTCYTGLQPGEEPQNNVGVYSVRSSTSYATAWLPAGGRSHAGLCLGGWYIVFVMMI